MRQGDVDAGIKAVGIPSLTSALNSQNGGAADDGAEDTALMAAVEAEYATFFTKKGGRGKRYEEFFSAVERDQIELDQARADIATLSAQVDRVARLEQERDTARKKLPAAEEELELRRAECDEAVKVKKQAEDVAEHLERATVEHLRALKQQADRAQLRARAEKAQDALELQTVKLAEAEDAAAREKTALALREQTLEDARQAETGAIGAVKVARELVATLSRRARRVELSTLLERIDDLDQQIRDLHTRKATEVPVTAGDVDALQKATELVKVNRALSQARGGSIRLHATSSTDITVGGHQVTIDPSGQDVELDREVTVTIGDVTMVVNPGREITNSHVALESAEADLAELLDKLGVDGVEELREQLNSQQKLITDLETLSRDRDRIVGGAGADTDALRAEHTALATTDDDGPDSGLTLEEARAQLTEAETRREQAGEAVKLADAALDALRQQPADRALTILRTRFDGLRDNVAATAADIDRAVQEITDEDLAAAVIRTRTELSDIEAEKASVDALLQQTDPAMAEQLLRGAQANVRSYTEAISTATTELVRLEGHIQLAAGASERHDKAYAALEASRNRLESEQRRARAAKRLRDVMLQHRESSRKRYAAPFADKLARLAARVFGEETGFDLDEQLSISTRSIGARTVNLDHLSGGAQEQLAILTRFAIADLVADSSTHGAVPVFIDDALGSTDPVRLTRISTLFGEAGRDSQVFVLTCVPERYNYVSPKTMHDIDSLKTVVT